MKSNDERAREILNSVEIPEEVSPGNMKKMLDEKAPVKKRGGISIVGRITAAAAACAVIVGGTAGAMKFAERSDNTKNKKQSIIEDGNGESSSEVSQTIEQVKAPYMSGAESYEQVYKLLEKVNKSVYNERGIYGAFATGAEKQEMAEDEVVSEKSVLTDENYGAADGGMGGGEPEEPDFTPVPDEDLPESEEVPGTETPNETEGSEKDHSETYDQEEGVLEADIAKTDGERIYYVYNAYDDEGMKPKMNIAAVDNGVFTETYQLDINYAEVPEEDGWITDIQVNDMYLYNDLIAVIGTTYSYRNEYTLYGDNYKGESFFEDENTCFVSFYTKSNEPQHIGTYNQDGGYSDVRIAPDGYMYLMTNYYTPSLEEIGGAECIDEYIPKCGVGERECIQPSDILLPGDTLDKLSDLGYTVIGSIDLTSSGEFLPCDTKALAGYSGTLYSSADNLYTAVGWENTDITRISVGGGQIVPEASGTIEGYVKDQFSMSEYDGYFRVASTVDKWTDNGNFITSMLDIDVEAEHISDNRVYVLDMDMNIVGSVGGFGENETIKSVSFSGNMGYVVTYEQTDPLFAIDLSDPAEPFITDEFKILGYSTYMQKWDDGLLLGFGADADENGVETGVKLVMFDNSDPYDLKEAGFFPINANVNDENEYIYSAAMNERKGLLIAPEKNLIGVPIVKDNWGGGDYRSESKYMFFSYENGEFTLRGEISRESGFDKFGSYVFDRAVYIGDYVYTLSGECFVSADIETLTRTDEAYFN